MKAKQDDAFARIRHILELEHVPYTQNQHYLQETKAKYLAQYKDARAGKLVIPPRPEAKRARRGPNSSAVGKASEGETYLQQCDRAVADELRRCTESSTAASTPHAGRTQGKAVIVAPAPVVRAAPALPFGALPAHPMFVFGSGAANVLAENPATPSSAARPHNIKGHKHKRKKDAKELKAVPANRLRGGALEEVNSDDDSSSDGEDSPPTAEPQRHVTAAATRTENEDEEDGEEENEEQVGANPSGGLSGEARAETENQVLSLLATLGYRISVADLGKLNPPDMYENELELMAEVRAYTQIAYKVRLV